MGRRGSTWALFLGAPLLAEFVSGDLPITLLPAMVVLAPLYGGGALLIREIARRTGCGDRGVVMMGVAFGLVEEGLLTQSLFNPEYSSAHLLSEGFVPALGIGIPWTVLVLTLHVVWGVTVPIVVAESVSRAPAGEPWLTTSGLVGCAVVYLIGCGALFLTQYHSAHFMAPPAALLVTLATAASFAVAGARGIAWARPGPRRPAPSVPVFRRPASTGYATFALSSSFLLLPFVVDARGAWPTLAVVLVILVAATVVCSGWARSPLWSPRHRAAAVCGPLGAYVWHAFTMKPVVDAAPVVDLVSDLVFSAAVVAVIAVTLRPTPLPHRGASKRRMRVP